MKRYTYLQLFKNNNGSNYIPAYQMVNNYMGSFMLPKLDQSFILNVPPTLNFYIQCATELFSENRVQFLWYQQMSDAVVRRSRTSQYIKKYMDLHFKVHYCSVKYRQQSTIQYYGYSTDTTLDHYTTVKHHYSPGKWNTIVISNYPV